MIYTYFSIKFFEVWGIISESLKIMLKVSLTQENVNILVRSGRERVIPGWNTVQMNADKQYNKDTRILVLLAV